MALGTAAGSESSAAIDEAHALDQLESGKAGKALFPIVLQASWSEGRASSIGSKVVSIRAEDASEGVGLGTVGDFGRSEDAVGIDEREAIGAAVADSVGEGQAVGDVGDTGAILKEESRSAGKAGAA